jgi:glycosyltransferase involved in cell wall biosynthesis
MSINTPKISIIVPVFNAKMYLVEALDSLCNQTLKEIEIICVNDGSNDGSWDILQKYAQKDYRIKLDKFEKPSGSAGVPRNRGMDLATGEYFAFLDADDYVDSTMFEKLYNKAIETKSDIVKCNSISFGENKKTHRGKKYLDKIIPKTPFSIEECPDYLMSFCFWTGIYHKKLLKNKFPKVFATEDACWYIENLLKSKKICHISETLHFYRLLENSSSNDPKKKEIRINSEEFLCEYIIDLMKLQKDDKVKAILGAIVINHSAGNQTLTTKAFDISPNLKNILKKDSRVVYKKVKRSIKKNKRKTRRVK